VIDPLHWELLDNSRTGTHVVLVRVGDRDQFWIASQYYQWVTGNLEGAQHSCEAWVQAYPRDVEAHALLSGLYQGFGRFQQAVSEGERALESAPDFPFSYITLAWSYILDNRMADGVQPVNHVRHPKAFVQFE
jgi:tetratricopeptide (TPR) repeat protein